MKSRVDLTLRREAAEYRLRFGCEACAHFVAESARCAHEYPNDAHLGVDLERREYVEFCKEFELA